MLKCRGFHWYQVRQEPSFFFGEPDEYPKMMIFLKRSQPRSFEHQTTRNYRETCKGSRWSISLPPPMIPYTEVTKPTGNTKSTNRVSFESTIRDYARNDLILALSCTRPPPHLIHCLPEHPPSAIRAERAREGRNEREKEIGESEIMRGERVK